jgi:hypothetical protein
MVLALVVILSVGAAAATMRSGGVTESRGVTAKPAREFRAPPRKPRVATVAEPRVDSALAASVRDSVALLIRQPAAVPEPPSGPPMESPEVNVPARVRRGDPLAQQIKQMLPDGPPDTSQTAPQSRAPEVPTQRP